MLHWIELVVIAKDEPSYIKCLNAFKQRICRTNYFDKRKAPFNIHWIIFQHRMFAINSPFSVWYYLEMLLPLRLLMLVTINQCCKRCHDFTFSRESSIFCVRLRLYYINHLPFIPTPIVSVIYVTNISDNKNVATKRISYSVARKENVDTQPVLSMRILYKRAVFLSHIIASTLSLNFFSWLVFGEVTEDSLHRQRRDVSWLRKHIGKTLLNVHVVLCFFTLLLGKVFVQPEWNPDSFVLMEMTGNCPKEIGVI